jgi:hypothetical protein
VNVVGCVLLCVLTFSACRNPARGPNVPFILVDTLRADRLGCYGNRDGLTPFIDRFAGGASLRSCRVTPFGPQAEDLRRLCLRTENQPRISRMTRMERKGFWLLRA